MHKILVAFLKRFDFSMRNTFKQSRIGKDWNVFLGVLDGTLCIASTSMSFLHKYVFYDTKMNMSSYVQEQSSHVMVSVFPPQVSEKPETYLTISGNVLKQSRTAVPISPMPRLPLTFV